MSEHDERVEALAKVLDEHSERGGGWFCSCSEEGLRDVWENHLARHLLDSPAMRDLLAAERAKALREAAERIRTFRDWYPVSIFPTLDEALSDDYVASPERIAASSYRHAYGDVVPRNLRNWADEEADRIHPADPEETR